MNASEVQRQLWADPQVRANRLAAKRTPEYRTKQSAIMTAQWADPEYRAKVTAAMRCCRRVDWTDLDEAVWSTRAEGYNWEQIAEHIGVSKQTLMRRVGELGIPTRRNHERDRGSKGSTLVGTDR